MNSVRQQEIMEYYCGNSMAKLKQISYPIFAKYGGIASKDYDDFYSEANKTVWNAASIFDDAKGDDFEKFLKGCLSRKFKTMMTRRNRYKRIVDRMCSSLEAPIGEEEGETLADRIPSDFDLESELIENTDKSSRSKMDQYLGQLSRKQRTMAVCLSEGYKPSEIREKLQMNEREYGDCMKAIKSYENISILF